MRPPLQDICARSVSRADFLGRYKISSRFLVTCVISVEIPVRANRACLLLKCYVFFVPTSINRVLGNNENRI